MINSPDLLEIILRYGPYKPLPNRVLALLAMEAEADGTVIPDIGALAITARVKHNTIADVVSELNAEDWLQALPSGQYQVNPFPACSRITRSKRIAGAGTHPVVPLGVGTAYRGGPESTLKVEPVSSTLAYRRTVGQRDCEQCSGTGWVHVDNGSVKECDCRGQDEALQGTQPSEHQSTEGHAAEKGS